MARAAAAGVAVPAGSRRATAKSQRRRATAPGRRAATPKARASAAVAVPARRAPARRSAPARRGAQGTTARRPGARTAILQRAGAAVRPRLAGGIERVLHGPGLIAVVFVLLAGVVFANVALLQKNRQITHDAARVSELKRENATLRGDVAELGSSERIQQVAAERGLVLPAPDAVRYLRSNPDVDALAAAKQIDEGAALAAAPTYADPAATTTSGAPSAPSPTAAYGTTPTYDAYGNPIPPVATTYDAYGNPVTGTEVAATPDAVANVTAGVP